MDDLIIVGAGWAGLSAAVFALQRQPEARIRLIAQGIGSPVVTPGWISVLDSAADGAFLTEVRALAAREPDHPYALAGAESLEAALTAFEAISKEIGLPYSRITHPALTPLGTPQHPALVPVGYSGTPGRSPLFVGFEGWRDYYPALSGPRAAPIRLPVDDRPWDLTPTDIARAFDRAEVRAGVVAQIRPLMNGVTAVGFPAVLGMDDPAGVIRELSTALGVPVFEMPTLPPSVPGTRLFSKLRRYLMDHGVRVQIGHPVERGLIEGGRAVGVQVAAAGKPQAFRAKAVLLATGHLYGGGLFSDDRGHVWEPIFGLPVQHNADRTGWFRDQMLATHDVLYFGVRADAAMQPLREDGSLFADGLYVAGQILAHSGPSPLETLEGVALATAYKAVASALRA